MRKGGRRSGAIKDDAISARREIYDGRGAIEGGLSFSLGNRLMV